MNNKNNILIFQNRLKIIEWLPKQSIGMEIGVLTGDFSQHMLNIINPRLLVLVDPWCAKMPGAVNFATLNVDQEEQDNRYEATLHRFTKEIEKGQIKVHRCKSKDIIDKIPDYYFDWIYIDGDHSEKGCNLDLQLSKIKIKDDGFIILDDYIENRNYGVIQAVDKFLINNTEFIKIGETLQSRGSNLNVILRRQKYNENIPPPPPFNFDSPLPKIIVRPKNVREQLEKNKSKK